MTDRFRAAPLVHTRRFDDEVVVLHLGVGKYFALDAVGARIWEELTSGKTSDEIVAIIVTEYAVEESVARSDLHRLADELLAQRLLEPRS